MKIASILLLVLFGFNITYAQESHNHSPGNAAEPILVESCVPNLDNAVRDLVERNKEHISAKEEPPVQEQLAISIEAYNDVLVEEQECMANVMVTVVDIGSMRAFWTLFHMHFFPNGMWVYKGYLPTWKPLNYPLQWFYEWCGFIESVYKKELEQQNCSE